MCSWMNGDPLKDSPLPPPCGTTMKLHWLTASLEHAGEISTEKVSRQSDSRIRTNWRVILSFSSVYFTSSFNAIWFRFHWFLNMTSLHRNTYTQIIYIYIYIYVVIPHTALLSHSKLPQGKFLHRDSPNVPLKVPSLVQIPSVQSCIHLLFNRVSFSHWILGYVGSCC